MNPRRQYLFIRYFTALFYIISDKMLFFYPTVNTGE